MIRTKREYNAAKKQLAELNTALRNAKNSTVKRALLGSQLELSIEISLYERISSGIMRGVQITSLNSIPRALIAIRMMKEISIQKLAKISMLPVTKLTEFEKTEYKKATIPDMVAVSTALGIKLSISSIEFVNQKKVGINL